MHSSYQSCSTRFDSSQWTVCAWWELEQRELEREAVARTLLPLGMPFSTTLIEASRQYVQREQRSQSRVYPQRDSQDLQPRGRLVSHPVPLILPSVRPSIRNLTGPYVTD